VRLALVLVALAACGDDEVGAPTKSGTRLALEWYQTDDGSRAYAGRIYDHARDQRCYLETWTDGTTRCLDEDQGFIVYSDAACTKAVVIGGDATSIAVSYDTCGVGGVFQIGPPVGTIPTYTRTQDGCAGPYSNDQVFAVGASIDRSAFALVDKTALVGGGRLQQIDYTSPDGLRLLDEVHDTDLATTCYLQGNVCGPTSTFSQYFSDAACKQRVTSFGPDPCGPPPAYYAEPDTACSDITHYYAIGAKISPTTVYALDGSMQCQPQMVGSMQEYHAVGEEVVPVSLSTAVVTAPGKRLQTTYYAGAGIALQSGQMFDTQLGVACAFTQASDGEQRCLPIGPGYGTYYADAACTRQVLVAIVSACAPVPQLARGSTGNGDDVRVVVGPYSGKLYYGSSGSCSSYQPTAAVLYEVGDLADGTQFASATTVTDP
jgi:hypothetical protein